MNFILSRPGHFRTSFSDAIIPSVESENSSCGCIVAVFCVISQRIGQTIVIENRGGTGGTIGTAAVATAEPDGYTLLINASAHSAAPAAYPHLSYDAAKDFAAIAVFGVVPNVMTIAPSKGIKSVRALVERGKQGGLTYASAGIGSATHWAAERFLRAAVFKATHVPFRGGP